MNNADAYNISVRRADFDGDILYEARVAEFPDLIAYGDTYKYVYDLIIDAIETTLKYLTESGKKIPDPIEPVDDYSGKFMVRTAKSLHKSLVQCAQMDGVSLNQYICNTLQTAVAHQDLATAMLNKLTAARHTGSSVKSTAYIQKRKGDPEVAGWKVLSDDFSNYPDSRKLVEFPTKITA